MWCNNAMRTAALIIRGIVVMVAGITIVGCSLPARHNYVPHQGYVPDAKTAECIAEAVWIPIYGKENIEKERPFHAEVSNGVWTVTGSLPKSYQVGGVAEIEIQQSDGKILRVTHGK